MSTWRFSHYAVAFGVPNGDLLLCNSFMGALVRIRPPYRELVARAIEHGMSELKPSEPLMLDLCTQGFFIRDDVDERAVVSEILKREREQASFSMILLPHENCNFRCTYCYEKFERGRMKPEVVSGLKQFVDRNISQWRNFGVAWFGGEPLRVPYRSGMTTNGYFLTPQTARELLDRRVQLFQVTMDGPACFHNDRRHLAGGGDTYAKILANLTALRDFPDQFVVRLRVNFDPQSLDAIEKWLSEIAPRFAGDNRFRLDFQAIGRWGGPNDANLVVCDGQTASAAKLRLFEVAGKSGYSLGTIKDFLSSHGAACYAGKSSSVVVGSDGTLYKCTVAFDDPRNHVGKITPTGELMVDKNRWEMWVGTADKKITKCGSCWFNASCQSRACPLVALDHPEKEPPCPSTPHELQGFMELAVYGHRLVPAVSAENSIRREV